MNILILTGKFGMGHWSASQSLRQQLLRAFPGAEVEVLDFVAEAMPNASEAMYKCFNLLVTRGSGLFNLYYKLTQDLPADARPLFETLFLDKLEELVAARRPDAVIATHPLCRPDGRPAGRGDGEPPRPSSPASPTCPAIPSGFTNTPTAIWWAPTTSAAAWPPRG